MWCSEAVASKPPFLPESRPRQLGNADHRAAGKEEEPVATVAPGTRGEARKLLHKAGKITPFLLRVCEQTLAAATRNGAAAGAGNKAARRNASDTAGPVRPYTATSCCAGVKSCSAAASNVLS